MENVLKYQGRRIMRNKKCSHKYVVEDTHETLYFKKKLIGSESVGARIKVKAITETGTSGPYDFIGFVDNSTLTGEWRALDSVAWMEEIKYRKMTKVPANIYDDATKTLRKLYLGLSHSQKQQFIANLIYKITK